MDRHYPGVPLKTSEWTHMQGGRDYGMDSALEQTKIIMEDLTVLNVTAWQLWIAVSNVDYCDGLIYENDEDRSFELTKRYYAFGNFSKFIAPGSVRFAVDAGQGLEAVGFAEDGRRVVVVANRSGEEKTLALPETPDGVYVTDETRDLASVPPQKETAVPAKSVTTFVFEEAAP